MKNVNYIINGVLAVAVVILFVLHFTGQKESDGNAFTPSGNVAVEGFPVAYVNIDSLIQNYNFAKDMIELQMKKQENARASIGQQMRDLQKEVDDFQRKMENNAFLTRERAEQEQARLLRKDQDIRDLDTRLSNELMAEQQKMNEQLRDSVVSQLKVFNQGKGYQIIFSNSGDDNILWAEKIYDISDEFIKFLNKGYSSPAK